MSKLQQLIKELCPDGVEYKYIWEVTIWDKKFSGVSKEKQEKTQKYYYYLSKELKELNAEKGDVKILTTYISNQYTSADLVEDKVQNEEIICIPWGGNPIVQYYNGKFITGDNRIAIVKNKKELNTKYLYYYMLEKIEVIKTFYRGSGIKHPSMLKVLDMKIPIPPLEVQEEIVKILDNFTNLTAELTAELTARKKQYEYYKKRLLSFDRSIDYITLGDVGKVSMCKRILKSETSLEGQIPFYKIGTFGKKADSYIDHNKYNEYKSKFSFPKKGDVLISASGTIGRKVIYDGKPAYFQDSNIVWLDNNEKIILNKFLYYFYDLKPWNATSGGTIARLYNNILDKVKVPKITIQEQQEIIKKLDMFDKLVNDLNEGLPAEIEMREKQYEHYRKKLLTFKEL